MNFCSLLNVSIGVNVFDIPAIETQISESLVNVLHKLMTIKPSQLTSLSPKSQFSPPFDQEIAKSWSYRSECNGYDKP